ncbi:MAG: Gfo/Idh/MocA family protein [Planctomycetota bacterium]|jgi:predicted dehydrogenase
MLKLGAIGVGGRGSLARLAHQPERDVKVTVCCDILDVMEEKAKERFGDEVMFTKDYHELLKQDIDAVFVLTPDYLHEEHAVAALEAGKHVYLEKPMHITIEGCDKIMRTAKDKGLKLFLGHNMRYMTIIRKMKKIIDDGVIGDIKSVWCRHFLSYGGDAYFRDWHADKTLSTGLLLQKGAHDIDVIHWLAGGYSKKVSAFGNLAVYGDLPRRKPEDESEIHPTWKVEHWPPLEQKDFNPVVDVEDQTVMIMQLDNGVLANYTQCHFTPDACRNYTFIGTRGRLENYGDGPESPIFVWNKRTNHGYRTVGDELYYGDPVNVNDGHGGSDTVIVNEFIDHITKGVDTVSTPQASRMSVAAGYQATMSLRQGGGALEIPPLDEDIMNYKF